MATGDQIELFLRNALRAKALEDRLIRKAIKDLRETLLAVQAIIPRGLSAAIGPSRETTLKAIVSAVARQVQQTWGIPQLQALQDALEPFVATQLEFGRQMVQAAGGTLVAEGAAKVNVAAAVNNAVVGGKTLSTQLTQTFPALVADRVERYLRLGIRQASGEVLETRGFAEGYRDAVVTITERNVEALIRTGVQDVGSAAQTAIYAVEADQAWLEGSLTWTAVLDSAVCPICVALDGREFKLGEAAGYWDGRNKISPHPNCRCYVVPTKWRDEPMVSPSGERVDPKRPAEGDSGEQTVSFKRSVNTWLRENPETTRRIFGKKLGNRLLDPMDSMDLPKAVKQWQAPKAT